MIESQLNFMRAKKYKRKYANGFGTLTVKVLEMEIRSSEFYLTTKLLSRCAVYVLVDSRSLIPICQKRWILWDRLQQNAVEANFLPGFLVHFKNSYLSSISWHSIDQRSFKRLLFI